jgi:hypothetical protein
MRLTSPAIVAMAGFPTSRPTRRTKKNPSKPGTTRINEIRGATSATINPA